MISWFSGLIVRAEFLFCIHWRSRSEKNVRLLTGSIVLLYRCMTNTTLPCNYGDRISVNFFADDEVRHVTSNVWISIVL